MCVKSFMVANYFTSCLILNLERYFDHDNKMVDESVAQMDNPTRIEFIIKVTIAHVNEKYANCINENIERELRSEISSIAEKNNYSYGRIYERFDRDITCFLTKLFINNNVFPR